MDEAAASSGAKIKGTVEPVARKTCEVQQTLGRLDSEAIGIRDEGQEVRRTTMLFPKFPEIEKLKGNRLWSEEIGEVATRLSPLAVKTTKLPCFNVGNTSIWLSLPDSERSLSCT